MHGEPTLFDMAEFEREAVAATPWEGVPLRYVTDYHHPDDLAAAFERWTGEHGNFGCLMRSHMWHRAYFGRQDVAASDEAHELHMLNADTRCDLAEHDHAMPGWRALPICARPALLEYSSTTASPAASQTAPSGARASTTSGRATPFWCAASTGWEARSGSSSRRCTTSTDEA